MRKLIGLIMVKLFYYKCIQKRWFDGLTNMAGLCPYNGDYTCLPNPDYCNKCPNNKKNDRGNK